MAFNPDIHEIDPQHGLMVDKETRQLVGIVGAPVKATDGTVKRDFPTWVTPHDTHVVRNMYSGNVSVPLFPEFFVDRVTKAVSVLVNNAEEEAKALAEFTMGKIHEVEEEHHATPVEHESAPVTEVPAAAPIAPAS